MTESASKGGIGQSKQPAEDAQQVTSWSDGANLEAVLQLPVSVRIVLGSVTMPVSALARLGRGSVVALDRKVGDPVDVVVNGRLVARGEVVVLEDDNARFGISLTEVVGISPPAGAKR